MVELRDAVSVIIPVYNSEQYLAEALESVLAQSLTNIEIICVNDGSTDHSLEILNKYAQKDSRVVVISTENHGAGSARNVGCTLAHGEYLSFLDADDFFDSDMLKIGYELAKISDADICVWNSDGLSVRTQKRVLQNRAFQRKFFPTEKSFSPQSEPYSNYVFQMFNGWAWDKLFRRQFILEKGLHFQEIRTTNDMFFVYAALASAGSIVAIDRILTHQRIDIASSLSSTREQSWDCCIRALCALKQYLVEHRVYPRYRQSFVNWALELTLWHLFTLSGDARRKLFECLKTTGFVRLDITRTPRRDFYLQYQYSQFLQIFTQEYDSYEIKRMLRENNE